MTLNWYNTQNNYPFSPKNPLRISQNSQSLKFVHVCHWIIQIILNPCSIQKNRHVFSDPKADISFLIWKKYVCVFDVKVILKKTYFWYNYSNKWSLFVENQALCNFNWYAHGNIQKSFVFNAMINIKSTGFLVTFHHRNNIIDKCLRYIVKCTFLLAILHAF